LLTAFTEYRRNPTTCPDLRCSARRKRLLRR
jgi:hypothetical protein